MELLNREDYEKILNENKVIFVFFYATWCPPCKMLKPIVEEYMENYPDNVFLLINTDNFKDIHKSYDIHNVPTILCFKNGKIVDTLDGYIEYEEIEDKFNELLA
ncbi:MAG: thioredoxin family protein [Erysipelotrichaceae bacterium]|nr:thioredoxin family protein [Erysipelotrichaceae bacterium]